MTTRQDLITLLNDELDAETLVFPPDEPEETPQPAKYEVTDYTSAPEIEKYCILNHIDVLFTVRRITATKSRFLQNVPHTDTADYTVAVWCIFTDGARKADYQLLRDNAVAEVQHIFRENPDVARVKNLQGDDDHRHGAVYILNTNLTVTKKTYI